MKNGISSYLTIDLLHISPFPHLPLLCFRGLSRSPTHHHFLLVSSSLLSEARTACFVQRFTNLGLRAISQFSGYIFFCKNTTNILCSRTLYSGVLRLIYWILFSMAFISSLFLLFMISGIVFKHLIAYFFSPLYSFLNKAVLPELFYPTSWGLSAPWDHTHSHSHAPEMLILDYTAQPVNNPQKTVV